MAESTLPPWTYRPKDSDPDMLRSLSDEDFIDMVRHLASEDSVVCDLVRSISFDKGSLSIIDTNQKLTVDFLNNQIIILPGEILPNQSLPAVIKTSSVRYAAPIQVKDYNTGSESLLIVVLSFWENETRDINSIYLVLDKADALLLINAVSKLISRHSPSRALVLRPLLMGKVQVARCSNDRHCDGQECCNPKQALSFSVDIESLRFYDSPFGYTPVFDLRFYKEQGPRSVDIIRLYKNISIQMQQGWNLLFITRHSESKEDAEVFDKLVGLFKTNVIMSKPEGFHANPESFEKENSLPQGQSSSRWRYGGQQRETGGRSANPVLRTDEFSAAEWEPVPEEMLPRWLNELHTGRHVPQDSDMMLMWCTYESDLQECIQSGTVPHSVVESGGLNPNSHDHLQRSLEDIKDHLLSLNMNMALSRFRACLNVFGDTLLQPVARLNEVEFMKRIFFLSERD